MPANNSNGVRRRSWHRRHGAILLSRYPRPVLSDDSEDLFPTLRHPRYSQSVERGLAVLTSFTPEEHLRGIFTVADELGMSRATTHRYMSTLVELGMLEQPRNGGRRAYQLGARVADIGLAVLNCNPVRATGRPILEGLRGELSHTVSSTILHGDEILILDRLRGSRGDARLKLNLGPASHLPVYCTSAGKVLLAFLPSDQRKDLLRQVSFDRRGPNTIITKARLVAELEQISQVGFAVDSEELRVGVHSIAVPVYGATGDVIAAVDVAAPTEIVDRPRLVNDFGPRLQAAADELSAALGYRPNTDQPSED